MFRYRHLMFLSFLFVLAGALSAIPSVLHAQTPPTRAVVILPEVADPALSEAADQARLFFLARLTSTGRYTVLSGQSVQRALEDAATQTGASPTAVRSAQLANAEQGLADIAVQLAFDSNDDGFLLSVAVYDPVSGAVIHADTEATSDRTAAVAARVAADTLARRWLTSPAADQLFGGSAFSGGAALSVFDVNPAPVRVLVNGRMAGLAPGQFSGLPNGPVVIRLEADGYAPLEREMDLTEGQMTDIRSLQLAPLEVPLILRTDTGDAAVLVDGIHIGETEAGVDTTFAVELSAQTLRVVAPGRRPFATMLSLSTTAGARIEFSMPQADGPDGQDIDTADCTTVGERERTRQCLVPAGEAVMGSAMESASADVRPERQVTLSRPFLIHRNEVTVRDYMACVEAGACPAPGQTSGAEGTDTNDACNAGQPQRGDHPMNCVSAGAAIEYCEWAGGTLPSEAQWERAARGTDGRLVPWTLEASSAGILGDPCRWMSTAECSATAGATTPVGEYPDGRSPYGLNDMLGNVAEWTADAYESDAYTVLPALDPVSTVGASRQVVRGSSYASVHRPDALVGRTRLSPHATLSWVGFRCVFDASSSR
jgi:formylglycine-generating enzyme required for sulfatase activity